MQCSDVTIEKAVVILQILYVQQAIHTLKVTWQCKVGLTSNGDVRNYFNVKTIDIFEHPPTSVGSKTEQTR